MKKINKPSILHKRYKKASHHERKQDTMVQTQQRHKHEIKNQTKFESIRPYIRAFHEDIEIRINNKDT